MNTDLAPGLIYGLLVLPAARSAESEPKPKIKALNNCTGFLGLDRGFLFLASALIHTRLRRAAGNTSVFICVYPFLSVCKSSLKLGELSDKKD